ncbi:hypothetical protein HUG10_02570 [Halorarum halophilum]|uniref:Uncharacterized protein n=1 Tax=Halorarum halophilum TaxID=2743090 RepID=A0A7D5GDW7_9EURY|nr:hypothetical protein [Halobaculum halophilum]QLG26490.1 hypothetical protein HUG10_02570 [Halobaculum halophilum]
MMDGSDYPAKARDRGQTTVDFAIGMGIFLLVTTFVVTFVPDIFAPFQGSSAVGTADRVVASLATNQLGDPGTPHVLDATCTAGFFSGLQGGTGAPTTCRFDTTVDEPAAVFGLPAGTSLNLTVEGLEGGIVTGEYPDGTPVTLAAGPTPPDTQSVTSGRRVVSIDGESYRLVARVW